MQRFNVESRITLKNAKTFNNPDQVLPAGSKGTVKQKFSDNLRYRVKFDNRVITSIVKDTELV